MSEYPSDSLGISSPVRAEPAVSSAADEAQSLLERRACARAQLEEIEKYRWYLGEQLGRDPLLDRTHNDICLEWIARHAAAFRAWWESGRGGRSASVDRR